MPPRASASGNGNGRVTRLDESWSLDDAIAAARAEAEDVHFRFTHNGRTYELPPVKRLKISQQALLAEGRADAFLSEVLGQEAFDEMTADMDMGDLEVLFNEWARVNGLVNQGNSSRSQRRASSRT